VLRALGIPDNALNTGDAELRAQFAENQNVIHLLDSLDKLARVCQEDSLNRIKCGLAWFISELQRPQQKQHAEQPRKLEICHGDPYITVTEPEAARAFDNKAAWGDALNSEHDAAYGAVLHAAGRAGHVWIEAFTNIYSVVSSVVKEVANTTGFDEQTEAHATHDAALVCYYILMSGSGDSDSKNTDEHLGFVKRIWSSVWGIGYRSYGDINGMLVRHRL
jgi:hypothetical protein